MICRAPPVALLALGHAAGALPIHLGAPFPAALLLPILLWRRPVVQLGLLAAALAGALGAEAHVRADRWDCRHRLPDGAEVRVLGRLPGPAADGRAVLSIQTLEARTGVRARLGAGCSGEIALALPGDQADPPPGSLLEVEGRWRASPSARSAAWAGVLRIDRWCAASDRDTGGFARLRTVLRGPLRGAPSADLRRARPARECARARPARGDGP